MHIENEQKIYDADMNNIQKLKEWYILNRRIEFIDSHDEEEAWNAINSRIRRNRRMVMLRRWGGIAAAVVLLGGAALIAANMDSEREAGTEQVTLAQLNKRMSRNVANVTKEADKHIVSVPMGSAYAESLTDGTKVVMNAGAAIEYRENGNNGCRELVLNGEAYFEVAHDETKPFVVSTNAGVIEVLGTHFNVVAEPNRTIVTLSEGSVRLRFGGREFIMQPGEQACLGTDGEFEVRQVNTNNYTSWSTGMYEFNDAPLSDIVRQLSLWYDVRIDIATAELKDMRFTGVLLREEPLESALGTLTAISDIKLKTSDNTIEIYE